MIYLIDCPDRCFANKAGVCDLLTEQPLRCDYTGPFYKPVGCKDWVRDGNYIIAPEDHERRAKESVADCERRNLYWVIRRVPKGKK